MDQLKIGKFIAERRKEKKLTQVELGEKLGVSDRAVSKWENGRCMPDLSLFEPLCKELDIKVNDLLSGEKMTTENDKELFEDNIINTIDLSKKVIEDEHKKISRVLIIIGIIICISAFTIFDTESSWSAIYSIIGIVIFNIGIYRVLKVKEFIKRILISIAIFAGILVMFYFIDYFGVLVNKRPPIYSYMVTTNGNEIVYYNLTYNVYRINADTVNEYYIVDTSKEFTSKGIPISPFNREKSGIDNLIKYKNKYVGNNSNDWALIGSLPLSEYGYVFEIDSTDLGLIIDYHTTDWYNNENNYIQKSLIYNSVSLFMLIDNVNYITYNFSGKSYTIKRTDIENIYPDYLLVIKNNEIDKENFNKYIEDKMNDDNFVIELFKELFY